MNKLCVLEVDNTEYKIPEKVIKSYQKLQQENKQLKAMICPIYEKCQKGECDCTHEEYNSMCERNMKISLELDKYKSIVEELKKYLKTRYEELEYANEYCIERDGCDNEYNLNRMEAYEEIENKIKELEEGGKND